LATTWVNSAPKKRICTEKKIQMRNTMNDPAAPKAEVVELRQSEIDSAPNVGNDESSRYIQGVASRDDDLLIVVDLNKLLTDEEWSEVSMF